MACDWDFHNNNELWAHCNEVYEYTRLQIDYMYCTKT